MIRLIIAFFVGAVSGLISTSLLVSGRDSREDDVCECYFEHKDQIAWPYCPYCGKRIEKGSDRSECKGIPGTSRED